MLEYVTPKHQTCCAGADSVLRKPQGIGQSAKRWAAGDCYRRERLRRDMGESVSVAPVGLQPVSTELARHAAIQCDDVRIVGLGEATFGGHSLNDVNDP